MPKDKNNVNTKPKTTKNVTPIVEFPSNDIFNNRYYRNAILSSSIDVLDAAIAQAELNKDISDKNITYLKQRLEGAKKIKKYTDNISTADLARYAFLRETREIKTNNKKRTIKDNNSYRLDCMFNKKQTTAYGCWSVSLSNLLMYHGIYLDQHDVRGYRPDFSDETINAIISEKEKPSQLTNITPEWDLLNKDEMGNAFLFSDLITSTIPNAGVRNIIYKPITSVNQDAVYTDIITNIANTIMYKKEPVSILVNNHYQTITGFNLDTQEFFVSNSSQDAPDDCWVPMSSILSTGRIELTWIEKLMVNHKGNVIGLPEGFKGISYVNGKVVPGDGYEQLPANFQSSSASLRSAKLSEEKSDELYVKQEQYVPPKQLIADKAILKLQIEGENNPGNGEKVLAIKDMTYNKLQKEISDRSVRLTCGDLYKKLAVYARNNNLPIRQYKNSTTFEEKLANYIAIYTHPNNHDSSSYYNRLNDEINELKIFSDSLTDDKYLEVKGIINDMYDENKRLCDARMNKYKLDAKVTLLEIKQKTVPYSKYKSTDTIDDIAKNMYNDGTNPVKDVDENYIKTYLDNLLGVKEVNLNTIPVSPTKNSNDPGAISNLVLEKTIDETVKIAEQPQPQPQTQSSTEPDNEEIHTAEAESTNSTSFVDDIINNVIQNLNMPFEDDYFNTDEADHSSEIIQEEVNKTEEAPAENTVETRTEDNADENIPVETTVETTVETRPEDNTAENSAETTVEPHTEPEYKFTPSIESYELRNQMIAALSGLNYNNIPFNRNEYNNPSDAVNYGSIASTITNACYRTMMSYLNPGDDLPDLHKAVLSEKRSLKELCDIVPEKYRDYVDILKSAIEFDYTYVPQLKEFSKAAMDSLGDRKISDETIQKAEAIGIAKPDENYINAYNAKHEKAVACIKSAALEANHVSYYDGPSWAMILKQKPGITKEENDRIDLLASGPAKDTAALAKLYAQELMNMPEEYLEKFNLDGMSENNRALSYYGMLAQNLDAVTKAEGNDLKKNYAPELLESINKLGNDIGKLYSNSALELEVYNNPLSKHIAVNELTADTAKQFLNSAGTEDSSLNSFASILAEYKANDPATLSANAKQSYHNLKNILISKPSSGEIDFEGQPAELLPTSQMLSAFKASFENVLKENGRKFLDLGLCKETVILNKYASTIDRFTKQDDVPDRYGKDEFDTLMKLNRDVVTSIHQYTVKNNNEPDTSPLGLLFTELELALKKDYAILGRASELLTEKQYPNFLDQQILAAKKSLLQQKHLTSERIDTAYNNYSFKGTNNKKEYTGKYRIKIDDYNISLARKQMLNAVDIRNNLGEKLKALDEHILKNGCKEKSEKLTDFYKKMSKISLETYYSPSILAQDLKYLKKDADALSSSKDENIAKFSKHISKLAENYTNSILETKNKHVDFYNSCEAGLAIIKNKYNPITVYSSQMSETSSIVTVDFLKNKISEKTALLTNKLNNPKLYQSKEMLEDLSTLIAMHEYKKAISDHDQVEKKLHITEKKGFINLKQILNRGEDIKDSPAMQLMNSVWKHQTHNLSRLMNCYQACIKHQKDIDATKNLTVEQLEKYINDIKEHKSGSKDFDRAVMVSKKAILENRLAEKLKEREYNLEKTLLRSKLLTKEGPSTIRDIALSQFNNSAEVPFTPETLASALFSEAVYKTFAKKNNITVPAQSASLNALPGKINLADSVRTLSANVPLVGKLLADKEVLTSLSPFIIDGSASELFKFSISKGKIKVKSMPSVSDCKKWAAAKRNDSIKKADKLLSSLLSSDTKLSKTYAKEASAKAIEDMKYLQANIAPKEIPVTATNRNKITDAVKSVITSRILESCISSKLDKGDAAKKIQGIMGTRVMQNALSADLTKTLDNLESDGINKLINEAVTEIKNPNRFSSIENTIR